jgi:surfeit locus 1 family protein
VRRVLKLRGAIVLLAAIAAAALTARLGFWQLDRAAQKTALQQALQQQRALPPLPQAELARGAAELPAQLHRRVRLQGRWLAVHTVFLENRQMNGQPGFYAVTPLQLDDGSAVLVQRGWVPRDLLDRTRVVAPPPPEGMVQVLGRIAPGPARLYEFDGAASGAIRQNLDVTSFARETGLPLRPLAVVQEDEAKPSGDGLLRLWPQPATGVEKHHGYAFQWFALCALIIGLYVWFQLIRPARRRSA